VLKKHDEAVQCAKMYLSFLQADHSLKALQLIPNTYVQIADNLAATGRFEEALDLYSRGLIRMPMSHPNYLNIRPNMLNCYNHLWITNLKKNEWKLALKCCRNALLLTLSIYPDNIDDIDALRSLASTLKEKLAAPKLPNSSTLNEFMHRINNQTQ
jgi:tetratricopeptide (TPR) repeat protein